MYSFTFIRLIIPAINRIISYELYIPIGVFSNIQMNITYSYFFFQKNIYLTFIFGVLFEFSINRLF